MTRRNYGQFCGLAHALDVVGERWTLLIVRELFSGPKRYTDLADALTGIGTSLLATRVRQLESDGVIQRRLVLDQPSSAVVYELTDAGHELADAVIPLAIWGARHQMADAPADDESFRAEWALSFLAATDRGGLPADLDAVYEFHIDGSVACLHIRNGRMSVSAGECPTQADASVTTTAKTVAAIAGQRIAIADATKRGEVRVSGDDEAVAALFGIIERRFPSRSHR